MAELVHLKDVLATASTYLNTESLTLIERAGHYAEKIHDGQVRKSGEPYIHHPCAVALELARLNTGPDTIAAGLLHDVLEDSDTTFEDLQREFNPCVANLVKSVTKIVQFKKTAGKEITNENYRKMFVAMASDIRVILIKTLDRLHNIRTLGSMPEEKIKVIAKETMEVYSPVMMRLGLYQISTEINDICFKYLEPELYEEISSKRDEIIKNRKQFIDAIINRLTDIGKKKQMSIKVYGREKSIYSLYKKLYVKNRLWSNIYDTIAIRVVVETIPECYEMLGEIHTLYRPIPGRFKDFIALPKPNMYKSLHTSVTSNEYAFEVQIRTVQMDDAAENGVAAHWKYKEGNYNQKREQREVESKLPWLKEMVAYDDKVTDSDYIESLRKEVFESSIYILTPTSDVINMPNGSTVLDFAYRVHSNIGDTFAGATVNGAIVKIDHKLTNGDVVNVITSKTAHPTYDWLKIVRTQQAKQKIKKYLLKEEKTLKKNSIDKGKTKLKTYSVKSGRKLEDINIDQISKKTKNKISNMDDMYYAVGTGEMTAEQVFAMSLVKTSIIPFLKKKIITNNAGVHVVGVENMSVELSNCCKPVPGDNIIGYISRKSVKVHKIDCPNVTNKKKSIEVQWDDVQEQKKYNVEIKILSEINGEAIADIVAICAKYNCSVTGVSTRPNALTQTSIISLSILVEDAMQLKKVMTTIKNISTIFKVEREIK